MRSKALRWLLFAALVIATAAFLVWRSPEKLRLTPKIESPLVIVPPGAALVVTLDVVRLDASPAGRELVRRGAGLFGLGSDDCAAQTIRKAQTIALAVEGNGEGPATDEPSELALIASGDFNSENVARCVERTIAAKKGQAVRTMIGSFMTIRDQRERAGEVAVREHGPLVVSNGRYLREILEGADGKPRAGSEPERARDALHADLRRKFGKEAPLIATVTLPRGWLERFARDQEARFSPLSELGSAALRVEPAGDGFVLELQLSHATPEAATKVLALAGELLPELRPWLEKELGARVAAQLTLRRDGGALKATVHLTADEFRRLLGLLDPSSP